MRLFEATGCGTLLITDWKENIEDFFKIDKEIVNDAHWASDLSGEEQPPFEGWFVKAGEDRNVGVNGTPIAWRKIL